MTLVPVGERLVPGLFLFALAATAGSLVAQQKAEFAAPLVQKILDAEPPEAPDVAAMRVLRSKTAFHVEIMRLTDFVKFLSKKYSLPFKLDPERIETGPGRSHHADLGRHRRHSLERGPERSPGTPGTHAPGGQRRDSGSPKSPPEAPVVVEVLAMPNANAPGRPDRRVSSRSRRSDCRSWRSCPSSFVS